MTSWRVLGVSVNGASDVPEVSLASAVVYIEANGLEGEALGRLWKLRVGFEGWMYMSRVGRAWWEGL